MEVVTPRSTKKKKLEAAQKRKAKEKERRHSNHHCKVVVQCFVRVGRVAKVKDAFNAKVIQGLIFSETHVDEIVAFLTRITDPRCPR